MTDTAEPREAGPAPEGAAGSKAPAVPRLPGDSRWRRLAVLLALTGFAFVQPVLDVTGRSPDFFLFRQPTLATMWLLVLLVAFAPVAVMFAAEVLVGLVSRVAERVLHLVFVAGLFAMLVVQVGKQNGFFGRYLALAAFVTGWLLAFLVARSQKVRQVLTYAAPAPLVFVLVFALTAPAGALLRPAKAGAGIGVSGAKRPPIVMMVFDEFPTRSLLDEKGAIDKRLYPNFARLAAASTWYPNATGLSGFTPYAIPPILTGNAPTGRMAPSYVEYRDSVFTMLGEAYEVHGYESISQLCPPQLCEDAVAGRATGFTPLLGDTVEAAVEVVSPRKPKPREGEEFQEEAAADRAPEQGELDPTFRFGEAKRNQPERLTTFIDGLGKQTAKPTFDFLHLLLPHIPFRYLPSGLRYVENPPSFALGRAMVGNTMRRNAEPGALAVQQQRMMLQLVYLDGLVGQVIDKLQASGMWDDVMVIVTADHGEGFTAGERSRQLDANNIADLAYVPMFVKAPGVAGGKADDRNAMNIDLVPTIADVLDVPVPFKVDGVSLFGEPRKDLMKEWHDTPGKPQPIDGARWAKQVRTGLAPAVARPDLGVEGLFAAKPIGHIYGKRVDTLTVGPPSPVVAKSLHPAGWNTVDRPGSGRVPALIWGDLDRPAAGQPTWLAMTVNGVVAGGAIAAPDPGGAWHFAGIVNDKHFKEGANDVRLYTVAGTTLHEIRWAA